LLEKEEDNLFDWFKNKQNRIENELLEEFCTNQAKLCCAKGHFGPKCQACPRQNDAAEICSGRGSCHGDGTRGGDGLCKCNYGYTSELCNQCAYGHFEEVKNETSIQCTGYFAYNFLDVILFHKKSILFLFNLRMSQIMR
jgi:hypothetical protein